MCVLNKQQLSRLKPEGRETLRFVPAAAHKPFLS